MGAMMPPMTVGAAAAPTRRDLALLALCHGLFMTNNVVFIAINGLVGLALAPQAWMATLPVTGYVVGGALSTMPVAWLQARLGRRRGFQLGLLVAMAAVSLCAWAVQQQHFGLLVAATVLGGFYNASAALYRFAGPELVGSMEREKAVSWVLAGGILGAVLGPNLASATREALVTPFVGAYLSLIVVALAALAAVSCIRFPPHAVPAPGAAGGRPLREIAAQPAFVVAVLAASLGYGVMNLLMSATPIAMQLCQHPFDRAALVLEWHVLGMFVPSFFTGHLIRRFGVLPVMAVGVLLNLGCVAVALSGMEVMQFLVALLLLGIGWNFLYVGGTSLLLESYPPEEKTRSQGAMDFCVLSTMAVTSVGSGALITTQGWTQLNLGSLVPIALVGAAVAGLALHRRRVAAGPRPGPQPGR
jgi:MFS family permease